jgi:hypothetical protein
VIVLIVAASTAALAASYTYGSTVTRGDDGIFVSDGSKCGIEVDIATDGDGIRAAISSKTSGQTTAYLYEDTDGSDDSISLGNQLDSKDISSLGSGDTVNLTGSVSSGSDYAVLMDAGGSTFTAGYLGVGNSQYTSTDIDMVGGYDGSTVADGAFYCYDEATLITSSGSSTPTPTPTGTTTATPTETATASSSTAADDPQPIRLLSEVAGVPSNAPISPTVVLDERAELAIGSVGGADDGIAVKGDEPNDRYLNLTDGATYPGPEWHIPDATDREIIYLQTRNVSDDVEIELEYFDAGNWRTYATRTVNGNYGVIADITQEGSDRWRVVASVRDNESADLKHIQIGAVEPKYIDAENWSSAPDEWGSVQRSVGWQLDHQRNPNESARWVADESGRSTFVSRSYSQPTNTSYAERAAVELSSVRGTIYAQAQYQTDGTWYNASNLSARYHGTHSLNIDPWDDVDAWRIRVIAPDGSTANLTREGIGLCQPSRDILPELDGADDDLESSYEPSGHLECDGSFGGGGFVDDGTDDGGDGGDGGGSTPTPYGNEDGDQCVDDIDGDGVPNAVDNDVDGDGIPNGEDPDVDGDGVPNGEDADIDGDCILNGQDGDADGDGIPDEEDDDTDGDGTPDEDDEDDDNDGTDDDEEQPGTIFRLFDAEGGIGVEFGGSGGSGDGSTIVLGAGVIVAALGIRFLL